MSEGTIMARLRSASGMLSGRPPHCSIPDACQAVGAKDETRHAGDGDLR